jgi:glycosyltransferase 2 family protein
LVTDEDVPERPDEARGGVLRSRAFAVARTAISLAIVAGLVYKLSPGELYDTVLAADPWLLVAAGGMMVGVQALVVVKWLVLLRARSVSAPTLFIARIYCTGNLLSHVLPTAVGGDVYRVYRVQREARARASDVTMTVLYERATGYGAMSCLGALGVAFYFGQVWVGALALVLGAAAAGLLALLLPRLPLPALRADHFLRNVLSNRREMMVVYQMGVFSLAIQALYISTIAVTGRAFGIELAWAYWAFVTWVVAVAVLAPITLGGLGVRESSFSALVRSAGGGAAQGASTGFALAALLILANAAGLLVLEVIGRLGYGRSALPAEQVQAARART